MKASITAMLVVSMLTVAGCGVADSAREMTSEEKSFASEVAAAGGLESPVATVKSREIFGGHFQEFLEFENEFGNEETDALLVLAFAGIRQKFPDTLAVPQGDEASDSIVRCRQVDARSVCSYGLVVSSSETEQETTTLLIFVAATSDGALRIQAQPYNGEETVSAPSILKFA